MATDVTERAVQDFDSSATYIRMLQKHSPQKNSHHPKVSFGRNFSDTISVHEQICGMHLKANLQEFNRRC